MRRRPSACRAARCTAGSNGMVSKATPRHERRVFWLALLGGFPALALALGLLWFGDFAPRTQWTLTLLVAGVWLDRAAPPCDGRDRRRHLRVRRRARAAAREPRRRRPARPRARAAARPRRVEPRSRRLPRGRYAARRCARFSLARGPLGSATRHVPAKRPPAPAARPHRREPRAE